MNGRGILRPGDRLRVWIERAGLAGALALTAWFGWSLVAADWSQLDAIDAGPVVLATALGAMVYAALGGVLVLAWAQIMVALGGDVRGQSSIYASTQLLKYFPGNVAHFVGRHVIARRRGLSHQILLAAAPGEAILLTLAAGLVSALAGPAILPVAAGMMPSPVWLIAGLFIGAALGGGLLVWLRPHWDRLRALLPREGFRQRALLLAFAGHVGFFLGCGIVGAILLASLDLQPPEDLSFLRLTGALALAWLAGFLVPGAPAGLGVRETVILALLGPVHGAPAAFALAALYRISAVCGDTLVALAGIACTRAIPSHSSAEIRP